MDVILRQEQEDLLRWVEWKGEGIEKKVFTLSILVSGYGNLEKRGNVTFREYT